MEGGGGGDKGAEFRERGSIFKQMGEMKKKIQLVEGERKAVFEDCENEKMENKDRVKKLKEEIRELQVCRTASNRPTFSQFQSLKIRITSNFMQFKTVV